MPRARSGGARLATSARNLTLALVLPLLGLGALVLPRARAKVEVAALELARVRAAGAATPGDAPARPALDALVRRLAADAAARTSLASARPHRR